MDEVEDDDGGRTINSLDGYVNNEPRFVPESMEVKLREEFDDVNQKLMFEINAEMACKPVDIPLEFVAEIDVGSGKMKFSNIQDS